MKKSQLQRIIQEEIQSALNLKEAYVPDNVKAYAKQRGVSSLVNKVAGWAEKVGKRITGGTAIGKNYGTLILDMGHQTADIYINIDNQTVELYGEEVDSIDEFKEVYKNNMNAEGNTISIPKLSDIDHTRLTKWMGSQFNSKSYNMKKSGKGFDIAIDKLSKDEQNALKDYLKSQKYMTESVITEGATKTILGIKFNIVPIQAGMKFEFKDASQFRKSGVNVNTLVDEITKMLDDKFGKGLFTFVPAGRDQSDPKVNGLEFKMNASNFFKGL